MMKTLSAQDLLDIWEGGQRQHTVDRALTILAHAYPEESHDQLATLTLGTRDTRLMRLREQLFGSMAPCLHNCPTCRQSVEFEVHTKSLGASETSQMEQKLTYEKYCITFRLFNSWDLAALANKSETTPATSLLIDRCIVEARHNEQHVAPQALPTHVLAQLQQTMVSCDPQSEVLIDLLCPECQTSWQAVFDIATYLWTEIEDKAHRLLEEVHVLARAYGWKEAEVLALSDRRRQWYLQAVGT